METSAETKIWAPLEQTCFCNLFLWIDILSIWNMIWHITLEVIICPMHAAQVMQTFLVSCINILISKICIIIITSRSQHLVQQHYILSSNSVNDSIITTGSEWLGSQKCYTNVSSAICWTTVPYALSTNLSLLFSGRTMCRYFFLAFWHALHHPIFVTEC